MLFVEEMNNFNENSYLEFEVLATGGEEAHTSAAGSSL